MIFNKEGQFSNTQTAILYDLPSEDDLLNWKKIKVLKTPLGIREVVYDPEMTKEEYLEKGFEEVLVGTHEK